MELALRAVRIDTLAFYNQIGCKKVYDTIQSHELLSQYEKQGLSFEDFCMVYAELRYNQIVQSTRQVSLLNNLTYLTTPLQWIAGEYIDRGYAGCPSNYISWYAMECL